MKLKLIYTFCLLFISSLAISQDCEQIATDCAKFLNGDTGKKKFISDGQVYTAFLDREKAEFKTTLYGGSTYRIAASAGSKENYVIFTVKDLDGNILFTNKKYKNSPYWDFEVANTIPVIIETELDVDFKVTGCAVMLIGFKQ
jgi:hypothetical protein